MYLLSKDLKFVIFILHVSFYVGVNVRGRKMVDI
jgi:hypothetical protein